MTDINKKMIVDTGSDELSPDKMVELIDSMMASGTARLKIKESEELSRDEILKEYHHGRCDIGSPWAKGQAFDVLE
ncbi:MAG: hypothetical protein MJ112_06775 [Lachnospiraceae bacterium]|nr:hypothetical protein [Lachnospiraceae bacterium]